VHDKGRYRQLVSGCRKRLHKDASGTLDFAEIPAPIAKQIHIEAFLTLTSIIVHYSGRQVSVTCPRWAFYVQVDWIVNTGRLARSNLPPAGLTSGVVVVTNPAPIFPLFRCGPGFKDEDIRPRVVSRSIQRHHRLIDFIEVEIGDD